MSASYTITRTQIEGLAQLITTLDDDALPCDLRINAATIAHTILAEVLGQDETLVYPKEGEA